MTENHLSVAGPTRRGARRVAALGSLAVAALVATVVPVPSTGTAAGGPEFGMICTENSTSSFVLTAQVGRILTPDGNTMQTWSYSSGNDAFQYPGPMLCVTEGDAVTVTLQNHLAVDTSVFFEGVEDVLANGVAASVQVDGSGRVASLIQSAAPDGSATYTFTAPAPGTYMYWSGTDPQLQREMGLAGGLVVRPADYQDVDGFRTVYGDSNSSFAAGQDYVHLLSEMDPAIHLAVETGQPVDFSAYRPRYFMINGRSFPDSVAPNEAAWLPSQPYGSLVNVHAVGQGQTLPSVIRYINASTIAVPFHPHSNSEEIIGIDARPSVDGDGIVSSLDLFAIDVQPGQTQDGRFSWTNITWGDGPGEAQPMVPTPDARNLQDGAYWSGDVFLGESAVKPLGAAEYNECGEYYHVAHNHALYAATNYGAAMGGQLTLVRVNPEQC